MQSDFDTGERRPSGHFFVFCKHKLMQMIEYDTLLVDHRSASRYHLCITENARGIAARTSEEAGLVST
jgi:hypothetical protein